MDGRWVVALSTLVFPSVLLGVTVWRFASNPLAVLALVAVMVAGAAYLVTYTENF